MTKLRACVVGVGKLGSRHARLYSELPGVELVGVVDLDAERRGRVASERGAKGVADFRDLIGSVDVASVAVPTVSHRDVACALLDGGVHVLVEKPIAASREEGAEIASLARERGLCLAVGHTERYNPAVEALLAESRDPRFIEVHRLGSFSPRSLDVDVVLDLMIHDLDVVLALVGSDVVGLEAVGVPVLTPRIDIANARLRFASGAVANVTASRVSRDKVRKLRVFEMERYVSLDYQEQEAVSYRVEPGAGGGTFPAIRREALPIERAEPLQREIEDFLGAVAEGRPSRVGGEDGLRALDLALRIVAAMAENATSVVRSE